MIFFSSKRKYFSNEWNNFVQQKEIFLLQGPAAHGRAAHQYIMRFLTQSYNADTRVTILPLLLSSIRWVKDQYSMLLVLTTMVISIRSIVILIIAFIRQTTIRSVVNHSLFSTCDPRNPRDLALAWEFTRSSSSLISHNYHQCMYCSDFTHHPQNQNLLSFS